MVRSNNYRSKNNLRSQFVTSKEAVELIECFKIQFLRFHFGTLNTKPSRGTHRKYLPYVFTEQGVSMLSAVFKSDMTVMVSIQKMEHGID